METTKKPTAKQLQSRIDNAVIFVGKTKDTKSIFFEDKGLRLTITDSAAVISTGYHSHVFSCFNASGYSKPYLYTKYFVDIALKNDCTNEDGYSYTRLLDVLKAKEVQTEYHIAWFFDLWLLNCFSPLYSIGESNASTFIVYEDYLYNIARNSVVLSEKKNDMTNREFMSEVIKTLTELAENMQEQVIFPKKTDEELMQEEVEAINTIETEEAMTKTILESKNENK